MNQAPQKMTVEVRKVINAPVERIFKAWTDPSQFSQWLGGDMVDENRMQQDLRVGGEYRIESTCEGKTGCVTGVYKEIEPNKKLAFTWCKDSEEFPAKDTLVTVQFIAKGNATEVIVRHTNFATAAVAQRHNMGWELSLEKLAGLLA